MVSCKECADKVVSRTDNFGDLISADQKVLNERCESRSNHRHAVVVSDMTTQWIQSHPCKTKTSQEPKGVVKVPGTRRGNQQSFALTIPNSVKLVKISPGIIARLHQTDRRLMVLLKEQCAE